MAIAGSRHIAPHGDDPTPRIWPISEGADHSPSRANPPFRLTILGPHYAFVSLIVFLRHNTLLGMGDPGTKSKTTVYELLKSVSYDTS